MSTEKSDGFWITLGVATNVISVVGIVVFNKYIIEQDGFAFSVFLSFLHFTTTAIGTRALLYLNYFEENTAPLSSVLVVSMGSLLSVAFMNLNLAYNSIGFYQVASLMLERMCLIVLFSSFLSLLVFPSFYWWNTCSTTRTSVEQLSALLFP